MIKLLISMLLCLSVASTQNTINIITTKSLNVKLQNFELSFIKEIISIYNKKNNENYLLNIRYLSSYKEIFEEIDKSSSTDLICSIRAITISKEREKKYDFSHPYMPIKQVLIADMSKLAEITNWQKKTYTIGAIESTVHSRTARKLAEKYSLNLYEVSEMNNVERYLFEGRYDYYVGDISDTWITDNTQFLADFDGALLSYYGILYPKNSILKPKFDKIITYFIKTSRFYKLLKMNLGENVVDYYKDIRKSEKY
jgi:hypothetical protein